MRNLNIPYKQVLSFALVWVALSGCVDSTQSDLFEESEDSRCDEAVAHLNACGQAAEMAFVDGCDPDLADEILSVECGAFDDPGKADLIGDLLCRVGLYHGCNVPECEEALPADFHEWGECADLIEKDGCAACDYYRCREETSAGMCGDSGYYVGFGYQYCLRYRLVTEPLLSSEGQAWSADARRCLMQTLEDTIPDSSDCEGLVEVGYDSHPSCYLGTGFCDLPSRDWLKIANTIDPSDVDFALMLEVARDCSSAPPE